MTLEIVILNQKRTFTIADSNVTINDCKTFEGEQKTFKISDRLSCVLLLSGNSEFDSQKMKISLMNMFQKQISMKSIVLKRLEKR